MSELLGFLRNVFSGLYDLVFNSRDTNVLYVFVVPLIVCSGLVVLLDFIIPAMSGISSLRSVNYHGFYYDKFIARYGNNKIFRRIHSRISSYRMDGRFISEITEFTDLLDPRITRSWYVKKLGKIHEDAFDGRHNKKFMEFTDKYLQISETGDYNKLTAFALAHPINFAFFKIFNSNFKSSVVNAQVRESYRREFQDVYGIAPTEQMLSEYIARRGRKSYRNRVNTFKNQYFSQ